LAIAEQLETAAQHVGAQTGEAVKASKKAPKLKGQDLFLTVGIGASAGGLVAYTTFFEHMPADSGMAFVLVQHLAPDHQSMLSEILGKVTGMPVIEAEDMAPVEPNTVYVIPPNATLTIEHSTLRVSRPAPPREHRKPIDTFFYSLAEDQGENAVCVILSGTGSDGTLGLKAIKENGGFTLAQADSDQTAMSGMPHSAVATGLVDEVLAVEDMPAKLIDYRRHLESVAPRKDGDGVRPETAEHLGAISKLLNAKLGHDFSDYKTNTLARRIQRRMQVLQIADVPAYVALLKKQPREPGLLFLEFLIGVTRFFRDPAAFAALETSVIPKLLQNRGADEAVRIWVPGCSTGEEVYSIAILLREAMERQGLATRIQIFGTDIDDRAVAVARAGRYRKIEGISSERLDRWFVRDGDEYCPIKTVREMCVFSPHSVVKDPPFSKLDLISCRNLLIYMNADLQDRVLRSFHYALNPNGVLFLGPSEGATRLATAFSVLDKKHRIFQRRDVSVALPELTPSVGASRRERQSSATAVTTGDDRIDKNARRALQRYSPVYVVVDERHEIVRFSGGETAHYLEPSTGAASLDLFSLLRKSLRPVVRAVIETVVATEQPNVREGVALKIDGSNRTITVIVAPIAGTKLLVVAFQDTGAQTKATQAPGEQINSNTQALEQELRTTKTQLHSTIDELETTNEEVRSAAEEYQSVNEELQSSNEELETAKEEMQSVNEELHTINAEMAAKNETMTLLNSDLKNLLESTDIATIFLDTQLRIKSFTSGMTNIIPLRDADRGRPVSEIVTLLNYTELQADARKVLRTLAVIEKEVRVAQEGMTFIMRIHPYRTVDNVIDGVVVTFVDISERKKVEGALLESETRYRALFEAMDEGFCIIEKVDTGSGEPSDFRYLAANPAFAVQSGVGDVIGKTIREVVPGEAEEWFDTYDAVLTTGLPVKFELGLVTQGRILELYAFRIEDQSQKRIAVIFSDISDRKKNEEHTGLLLGELDHRVKNILSIVSSVVRQTLKTSSSTAEFGARVDGRIAAIARAHGVLTQSGRQEAALLRDLIAIELAPYDRKDNLLISGPDLALTPKASLSIAMALHELASNAAKYGALSKESGRLVVKWFVGSTADRKVRIVWSESEGPVVEPPTRKGFGTTMIERSLAYEFGATVKREFLPSGLVCTIDILLTPEVGHLPPLQRRSPNDAN
jgi:two-component system CheB/CheR fusion protein